MTTRKYKTNIFVKTTVWILVFSFVYGNVQTGYSSELDSSVEKYTLAPNTFQDDLAEYEKKQPGRLERVYRRFRSLFGKGDLSGWLPLGLVGALFRDYVSSLPEEEKTGYRRQYADFVKDIKGFSRLLSKVTGDGNKIAPIRIDTVISLQRQDVSYGVNELIANGIDGVLKDRGMWRHLIGQFGEGFFLILKELEEEESSDPNDRIVLTTSVDGKTALRTEFRRVGENYYMRFEVIDKNVRKGTHIRVYKSNFSKEIMEDGKIITRQELRNRKIAEAFSYNLSLPIILNGRRRHVNSLDNFSGMEELFGTEPQYLVEDDCIKINVYKDGYEVRDNGCGIDLLTYFEQLLVPRSSSHEEERPVKKHDYTSSELREEIRFFYRLPEEPEIVIETEVALQVSGVCIERFKVNGINIPERMVIELPRWTSVGGEGRNKIKMDDLTIKAFKYIVDKVLGLKEGTEQDILLNGLAGVLREKQRIDKETGMVRHGDDLLQYIYNKAKKRNERFSGEMVLPNQEEFLCFIPPERYTKRYLDKDTFLFDPKITPCISAIKGYSVFGRYLFLADFNDPEQIYQEWGSYIFIDRKIWKEAENKDSELLAHGKEPEHVENLIKHLEHNMSFYIGYGPEPDRVYFEEKDGEPRERRETEDTVKTPVFDSKFEAERLVFSYEDPKVRRLKNRVIMELEVAVDPRKRLEEIKSFLDNLTEFLLTMEPYMENIDWPWLLFSDKSGLLNIEEFHLLKDFRKRKAELEELIRQINEHIGFEFNNGRNLDARRKLILNLAKLNLWHFDLSKISLFLPFMDGRVLRLLTRELLDEWYRVFSKESLETIRQFAQFFNIVSPVISERNQLRRYSERWYKIFSRYRKHSRMFIQLLKGRYPYRGHLPSLSSGGEEPGGVRTEPDWERAEARPAMKVCGDYPGKFDITQDGEYMVTAEYGGLVKVWKREGNEYKEIQALEEGAMVYSARFSPGDTEYIVTGTTKGATVWVKDGDKYRKLQTLEGHKDHLWEAQFSPDSEYIVTAGNDGTAIVWKREKGKSGDKEYKILQVLEEDNRHTIGSASFSPDGNYIVTAYTNGIAKIWKKIGNKYREIRTLRGHGDVVHLARFSPDGNYIVTASRDGTAKVWLIEEDKCELLNELEGHKNDVRCAQFSPGDGKYIVTIGLDNTAKIWETSTGKLIKSINLAGNADFALFTSYDREIAVMSVVEPKANEFEGHLQIIQAGIKPVVTAESAQTGPDWENLVSHESVKIHDRYTPDLDTALDGKYLVTAVEDGTVKIWVRGVDNNYTELQTIKAHEDNVCSAKFSSDGQYIITASNDETAKIWVKEGDKFQLFQTLRGHTKQLQSAQFSHDGQYIVTASLDCTARVWVMEGDGYKLLQTLKGHNLWVASAQFSNDGQYLITAGGDGTIKVWIKEGNKYELLQTLAGHTAATVNSAQFSPDGKYFVSSGDDQTARVWVMGDSGKYTELYVLWHINWVNSAQFSNDGQYIVTACADGTARVWETVTGRMVKSIDAKNECRRALFISSDTEIIATSHFADDGCHLHVIKAGVKPVLKAEPSRAEPDWENAQVHKGFKVKDWDVRDLDVTPDGKYILTAFRTGKVKLWEKGDDGKCNELQTLVEYNDWASSARFSHDLEYIVTTSRRGPIEIFKRKGNKYMPFQTIEGYESYEQAWFSPDGKSIVAQGVDKVEVFVRKEHEYVFLQSLGRCKSNIQNAMLSPDGEYIAIGRLECKVEIWRKEDVKYKLLQVLEGHDLFFHSKCFNSNGEYMITRFKENILTVWKRENGKYIPLQKLDHGGEIRTAQISPDGECIVIASYDGLCKLWMKEGNEYKPFKNLEGYNHAVNETQFSSDGRYLATVGEDEPAKIWEVSTGKLLRTIKDISYDYIDGDTQSCILFTAHDMEILAVSYDYIEGSYESEPTLFVVEAGIKPELDRLGHIPGWRFLQEGVSEEQAPFELQKYLRYLKPEEAEFLVEREPADFHIGKEEFKIEGVELARLIMIARLMRKEVFREGLSLEELDELLKQKEVKEADLSAKRTEIEQAILGQEDSFYLFLRELVQNSRDAICGGRTESDEINFTGFLGQGFYTLFSNFDFDEVRIKTSIGDGNIYYLTFVKEVDGKGRNIIKISNIERRRQAEGEVEDIDIPVPEEIDIRSYIPKGKKEWIVSITDPVGMDLFTIINYLLVPDNTLKQRVPVGKAKKGRYWKGTEIQRVKYFTGHENEPQLEALITYEYASLYNGAVNRKDSPIHFNRFPEEESEGVPMNEDKERLATVTTTEGDFTFYWCSKRGYNRLTHKDLYFHDPEDHSDPDYAEFMPQILLDELYRKGLTIDIPKGMRLIRTRNALADEQKHLLPLKKAIAVGAMKASVYLMLKHEIYLPTLPQDFFNSVTQPFDEHLAEENLETADMINKGRWNEISQERFRYLSNPENFSDLIQVIRNIKVERKDEEGRLIIQTLEEHRREILEAARSGKSFEDIEDSFKGIAEGIKARMKHGFRTAKSFHEAENIYYKYTERDIENSPIMSLLRVLLNLLAEAMDSPGVKNSFIYSSKPGLGAQGDKEMFWNLRALSHSGWIDKLIKVIDNDEDIDKDFIYEFFIWVAEQDTSHEFLHVHEHLEDRRHMRKVRDSHVAETWAKGAQGYEQKKLLKKIIKNRFHVQEVVRRLKEEFSREKRRDRFGTEEWDIDRIMKLAKSSANAFMVGEVEGEETKASIRERFKPCQVIRYRLDNGQLVIGELKTYDSGEIVLDSNNNAKFDENPVPETDRFYKLIKNQMEILYRTDPGVTLLFVKGENVLNFQRLDRLQFAKRSNHKRRRQITLPYNMLYLLECIEDKEGAFEYITTYENIRKDNMNETVSRVMELTDAKLEDADTKRRAFLELLQLSGAVEDIVGKIAEHCHGDMGRDLRLYLDEDGVLAVRNTNDTKAIFSIDSDYIEHVSVGQHKLTYWDILRNKLKGCKDTESEIIIKGTDLAGIRQILIQVLIRRELIRREKQETDGGRSYGALSDTNLDNLGVLADENQEGKKMIAIGSTCLLTIEEGKDGKYTYSQNATGIRYILERINQGFDVEVINEQEELIKEDHMQLVLKEIFGTQLAVITKGAYIARDKRDGLLLLSDESKEDMKLQQENVVTIVGSSGVSFNVQLTLGIYKLFNIEDKDSNMKNILLALGYTDEQADGILSSKGVIKLPPIDSFTHIINTIATFTRTIDISA